MGFIHDKLINVEKHFWWELLVEFLIVNKGFHVLICTCKRKRYNVVVTCNVLTNMVEAKDHAQPHDNVSNLFER
jgi:hypothetical protein